MGRAIEVLALEQGHEIGLRVRSSNADKLLSTQLTAQDVAIEFSRPSAAFRNVVTCIEAGVPVVSGTTGWTAQLPEAIRLCEAKGGALLHAANFSVGVNIFFALNRYLARMLRQQPAYQPSIEETHHTQKLDAPSGTAIVLAEDILAFAPNLKGWALAPGVPKNMLPIEAQRMPDVPGTHVVRWRSQVDTLELRHEAHSRVGFAAGALRAAEWIIGRKGVFTMNDVLGIEA